MLYVVTGQRSQAAAEVDLLPSDERVLVDAYRRCNAEAKRNLIQTAALLSAGMGMPSTAATPPKRAAKANAPAPSQHATSGGVNVGGGVGGDVLAGGAIKAGGDVTAPGGVSAKVSRSIFGLAIGSAGRKKE